MAADSKTKQTDQRGKYWANVLYPENMIPGWEDNIDNILEVPYSWTRHDKDVDKNGDPRKEHIDFLIAFPNTTTYKHALETFNLLSAPGKRACNTCQKVYNIRNRYNYQIHDTDDCRKKGKHQYSPEERHTGNGFDIGNYEQVTLEEKNRMARELAMCVVEQGFTNFVDFFQYVISNYDEQYFEILKSNNGFFERLTKGNYQKKQEERNHDEL